MSTNFSDHKHYKNLSDEILKEFNQISEEFSSFQNHSKLTCIEGCGKCCFKTDIYCSPIELLPMALELLKIGKAQEFYEKCQAEDQNKCVMLVVHDEEKYLGNCSQYDNRPLVCRTFGVSVRHGKNSQLDFSICKPIKENKSELYQEVLRSDLSLYTSPLPFIDMCKNRLISMHPLFLENEMPIKDALKMMLEKVLLYDDLEKN